jgi:adenine-specific DNA-methyltransferase
MDFTKKTKAELISFCKENNIKVSSSKKKEEIIQMIHNPTTVEIPKIKRLNYIGSKFQLLDWITLNILEHTKWTSFEDKTIADLFSGTGVVSYHFRNLKSIVISNDSELYSHIITFAFTKSCFTEKCREIIENIQQEIQEKKYIDTIGFITKHYSPFETNERKFFTVDNAQRIDYIRTRIEMLKESISLEEYNFILASLLISADAVSNVPAVYGCYLKNFKAKAIKELIFVPIHTNIHLSHSESKTFHSDILNSDFLSSFESDLVYLDPPYNERQYSKNYFPLNVIAKNLFIEEPILKGKTGIPTDCFISSFCKKAEVEKSFDLLFSQLKTKWIFLSYNSESILSKEKILEIMSKYGSASVVEKSYKRFKSYEYNNDVEIKEYLFILRVESILSKCE